MTIQRFVAVGVILFVAGSGWWFLGRTTEARSTERGSRLGEQVEASWGVPLVQHAPSFATQIPGTDRLRWLEPRKDDITVDLNVEHRRRGLIWYPTYNCDFVGTYTLQNTDPVAQKVRIHFDFPAKGQSYEGFSLTIGGQETTALIDTRQGIDDLVELAPGQTTDVRITYSTRGIGEWRYQMNPKLGKVADFALAVETNFRDIDYPLGTRSATSSEITDNGLKLTWRAEDRITQEDVGVIVPEKLNPGPLTSRITFFAPVCLLFFFVLVGAINIVYKVNIHPMHYLFVAAGFFAFHLLLSYMVGIVNIHVAFIISAIVSVTLVTSYLAGALRGEFPWKVAVAGQLFFLVLFSYSFFLKGITGLTVAIGSVVTLAILM
ncbi:MAG: hypothetical protein GWP08_04970, partial [Nitrospiraceae bacterium]|nr:hypothetical protein [Nitrospiraceae bacterium]